MKHYRSFLFAGAVAFAVDASMLLVFIKVFGFNPFVARIGSIACAVLCGWLINRNITFAPSGRAMVKEGARYGMVAAISASLNYGVYSAVLLTYHETPPVLAAAIASATATVFSYVGYLRLVFGGKREPTHKIKQRDG